MVQPQRVPTASSLRDSFDALVTQDGTNAHPYVQSGKLVKGRDATRNLADAVHFVSILHGSVPGLIGHAALVAIDGDEREWFAAASDGFARERAYLSRLGAAVGPMPSTVGQQACEQTVVAQAHAVATLGGSERAGCALGGALALAIDWRSIRAVLDSAAARFDVTPPALALPDLVPTARLIDARSGSGTERAMLFGAQQLLAQHRGLWDLLASRELARSAT